MAICCETDSASLLRLFLHLQVVVDSGLLPSSYLQYPSCEMWVGETKG